MVSIFKEYVTGLFELFKSQMKAFSFGVNDFFDILIVWVLLYYAYKFIRKRRAGKLAIGVVVIMLINVLSDIFSLSALGYIISNFFQIGLLALVIIFQPELRSVLEQAGGTSLKGLKNLGERHLIGNVEETVEAICSAACDMSASKTGALIVFENETGLDDIVATGTVINADISSSLLKNIFFVNTPLHDGAVVIRDGKVGAAGCYLPLSDHKGIAKELGTRHRAAIGISEVSDALVLVVSEETGNISIAQYGEIRRNFDYMKLKKELTSFFVPNEEDTAKGKINRIAKKTFERGEKHVRKQGKTKKNEAVSNDTVALELFDEEGDK